jgi:hypothetical protein
MRSYCWAIRSWSITGRTYNARGFARYALLFAATWGEAALMRPGAATPAAVTAAGRPAEGCGAAGASSAPARPPSLPPSGGRAASCGCIQLQPVLAEHPQGKLCTARDELASRLGSIRCPAPPARLLLLARPGCLLLPGFPSRRRPPSNPRPHPHAHLCCGGALMRDGLQHSRPLRRVGHKARQRAALAWPAAAQQEPCSAATAWYAAPHVTPQPASQPASQLAAGTGCTLRVSCCRLVLLLRPTRALCTAPGAGPLPARTLHRHPLSRTTAVLPPQAAPARKLLGSAPSMRAFRERPQLPGVRKQATHSCV